MHKVCLLILLTATITLNEVFGNKDKYYWREYLGVIPPDALPAGKGLNGQNVYIGQAYIHGNGLFVVGISIGQKEFNVPSISSVRKVVSDIKILCTENPFQFEWITTNNKFFHINTTSKHVINGGYMMSNSGRFNIGRLMHQGNLKVGEISAYQLEDAKMYFVHDIYQHAATFFEALVYNDNTDTLPAVLPNNPGIPK